MVTLLIYILYQTTIFWFSENLYSLSFLIVLESFVPTEELLKEAEFLLLKLLEGCTLHGPSRVQKENNFRLTARKFSCPIHNQYCFSLWKYKSCDRCLHCAIAIKNIQIYSSILITMKDHKTCTYLYIKSCYQSAIVYFPVDFYISILMTLKSLIQCIINKADNNN